MQLIFTAETSWSMVEIRFLGFQYRYDDSDIRLQGDFCICLCEIISDILSHWLPAVEWRSVSETKMKAFSVGHMSATDLSSTDFLSSISTAFLHFVEVPNFLNLWDHKVGSCSELWYHFSQFDSCYEQPVYSSWGIVYITVISLCIVWVFICRWLYCFSRRINTESFIFLISLWFSSPTSVTFNLLCLNTKVLNPVASL